MPSRPGRPSGASKRRSGKAAYHRVLLKLTGQSFAAHGGSGIDLDRAGALAHSISACYQLGADIAIVVGGGNLFKGTQAEQHGMNRAVADYVGMLATCINALCLQEAVERLGLETRLLSGIEMRDVAEPFVIRRALRHLETKRVVIFAAGTGSPFLTTDTAAVLRALQVRAEILLKGTDVDGVYSGDPRTDPKARLLRHVTYDAALQQGLKVMDSTAFSLSKDHGLPILVFNMQSDPRNLQRAIMGEPIGTLISALAPPAYARSSAAPPVGRGARRGK